MVKENEMEMQYMPKRIKKILYYSREGEYEILIMSYGTHPCGYVGIPKTHRFHGKHYDDVFCDEAHGGFTFSSDKPNDIIDYESTWWFGFDCAHLGDFTGYDMQFPENLLNFRQHKWTTEELIKMCENVIEWFKEVE